MTEISALRYMYQFLKNCPHIRLIHSEREELARLFTVAKSEARRLGMEEQMAIIDFEAAAKVREKAKT